MKANYGLVLLCESDDAAVDVVAKILRDLNVHFAHVTTIAAAVHMRFHVEFSVMLVGGCPLTRDGYAAAREIRRAERAGGMKPLPILALRQAHIPMPELGETYFEAGIDGALAGPLTGASVYKALQLVRDGMYSREQHMLRAG